MKKRRYMLESLYQLDCLPTEPMSDSWCYEFVGDGLKDIDKLEKHLNARGVRTRRTVLEL